MINGFTMSNSWLRGYYAGEASNNLVSILPERFTDQNGRGTNLFVNINNSWMKFAGGSCLYIQSTRTTIIGNQIYGCGKYHQGNNFLYAGVDLKSSQGVVTGNQFCGGDVLNDITWPMRPGYIAPGVDYTVWTGNVFAPSVGGSNNGCAAGISNNSTGTHNVIAQNAGG